MSEPRGTLSSGPAASEGSSSGTEASRTRAPEDERRPRLSPLSLALLSSLLGLVAGLGAFGFRTLIALIHNVSFLGVASIVYDSTAHTPPSPWGPLVLLVPAVGGVLVVFLVENFAPEARGHGVPEVMDAIYYAKSEIRPIVSAVKAFASALSIGTGGSVGREGPIVQIAAAFGSQFGRLARVSRWQRATLVAAGAGAGIAATFNTPIGGVLFAVEVLAHELSVRTLVPIVLATAMATYVGRALFGDQPAFPVPPIAISERITFLPAYVALGVATAVSSTFFIRALYGTEDWFERVLPGRPYLRHVIGMLGVGCVFIALFAFRGHYYVEGVGYATIVDALRSTEPATVLALLFLAKLAVTCVTLGSGASGGVFSPCLFLGATLGGAFGTVLGGLVPCNPAVFALAGMAGMVAGSTGAVLTAIVMIFEMTLDYGVILPMTLTATVSYGLRRFLLTDSIYTMKLSRRGHVVPGALQANAHFLHHATELSLSKVVFLPADATAERLVADPAHDDTYFIVVAGNRVVSVIPSDLASSIAAADPGRRLGDIAGVEFGWIHSNATLLELLSRMRPHRITTIIVATPESRNGAGPPAASEIVGVLTQANLVEALAEGMELFED